MANARRTKDSEPSWGGCGTKKLLMGALLFILGLVKYMGYDWDVVLMVAGVLVFLKGLMMKFK